MAAASGQAGPGTKNQTPKKSIFGSIKDWWSSPAVSSDPDDQESEEEDPEEVASPLPGDLDALRRDQARAIDRIFDERAAQEADAALRDGTRKLRWNLQITQHDAAWQTEHARIHAALASQTVQAVLDAEFEEAQRLLAIPAAREGALLDIQTENAKKYKQALKIAAFAGQKDNLTTKFTMLKFGLPIEAMTLNNILNAGKDLPGDDPEDDPEVPPTHQRVMYAEKPLEFLDTYHDRSWGNPHLRRPKPNPGPVRVAARGGAHHKHGAHHRRNPMNPGLTLVSMRGGATPAQDPYGGKRRTYGNATPQGYSAVEAMDSPASFLTAVKQLFDEANHDDYFENDDWIFHLDVYTNQERHKQNLKKLFLRTWAINKDNYEDHYDQIIRHRLFNAQTDWIVVVRHPGIAKPARDFPAASLSVAPTPVSKPKPKKPKETKEPKPTRDLMVFSGGIEPAENTHTSFRAAAVKLLKLKNKDNFEIDFYSNQLDTTPHSEVFWLFHHKIVSSEQDFKSQYERDISERFFDPKDGWVLILHPHDSGATHHRVPHQWYPLGYDGNHQLISSRPKTKPARNTAYLYGPGNKKVSLPNKTAKSFEDGALKLLEIEENTDWRFQINFFSNQLSGGAGEKFPHHLLHVSKSSFEQQYLEEICARAFDGNDIWILHVAIDTTPSEVKGFIYSYSGKRRALNTFDSFSSATYRLLRKARPEDRADDFKFFIDIHGQGVINTIQVTRDTFIEVFRIKVLPLIPLTGTWPFFVRLDETPSVTLEPPNTMTDIIKLHYSDRVGLAVTAYWKIPRNLLRVRQPDYGHNQYQNGFHRAMEIILPPDEIRPRGRVHIEDKCLGPGGMDFAHRMLEIIRSSMIGCTETQEFTVKVFTLSEGGDYDDMSDTIHLVGTQHLAGYRRPDYGRAYDEILDLTRAFTARNNPPVAAFRLWASQELRECNGPSVIVAYKPKAAAVEALRTFITSQRVDAQCVAFRPEYVKFTITHSDTDVDPGLGSIDWDAGANNNSFASFKARVDELFRTVQKDINAPDMFYVTSLMGSLKHVVTNQTTEEEWRRDVFDWLHSKTIHVRRASGLEYVVDQTTKWGLLEVATTAATLGPPDPVSSDPESSDEEIPDPPPRRIPRQPRIAGIPRFNKTRVTLPRAAQPQIQRFTPWAAEQSRQDRLQRDSWFRDQSVIEPGQKPEAPIFGPSRELALTLGSSLPTLYSQRITPTDITQILDENRDLRNRALERMINCTMCDIKFAAWDKDKIQEHWNLHKEQIASAGRCLVCGTDHWIFWSVERRKEHLEDHYNDADKKFAKEYWNGLQCPVCDLNLFGMRHEDVLLHVAEHPSGVLQFCDRCGLHTHDCNVLELAHHKKVCTEGRERTSTDRVPEFCDNCGMDVTQPTADQEEEHRKNCGSTQGFFCDVCGLELKGWSRDDEDRHRSHCQPPRGFPKKHCRKCAYDLSAADAISLSSHAQTCYINDPRITTEGERLKELRKRQILSRQTEARINSSLAYIRTRTQWQDSKKRELNQREEMLNALDPENPPADLGRCPFEGCGMALGTMSGPQLVAHFGTHSGNGVTFECPLDNCDHEGTQPRTLTMANGGQDLREHYQHIPENVQASQTSQQFGFTTKSTKKRRGGKVLFTSQQAESEEVPAIGQSSKSAAEGSRSKATTAGTSSRATSSMDATEIASPDQRMQTPTKVATESPNSKHTTTSRRIDSVLQRENQEQMGNSSEAPQLSMSPEKSSKRSRKTPVMSSSAKTTRTIDSSFIQVHELVEKEDQPTTADNAPPSFKPPAKPATRQSKRSLAQLPSTSNTIRNNSTFFSSISEVDEESSAILEDIPARASTRKGRPAELAPAPAEPPAQVKPAFDHQILSRKRKSGPTEVENVISSSLASGRLRRAVSATPVKKKLRHGDDKEETMSFRRTTRSVSATPGLRKVGRSKLVLAVEMEEEIDSEVPVMGVSSLRRSKVARL